MSPNIDGKVTNVKKSAKFHHSLWRLYCVQFEATIWTGEIFPFLTTAIKCQEVGSIPSFRTWATHPQFGLLWAPNKENLSHCYPVRPYGKCRDWTQFHRSNFPCDWRLHFHLLKCDHINSIYFCFRSEVIWFSSRFFQAKIKMPVMLRSPNYKLCDRFFFLGNVIFLKGRSGWNFQGKAVIAWVHYVIFNNLTSTL